MPAAIVGIRRRRAGAFVAAALAAVILGALVLSPAPTASGADSASQVTVCDHSHLSAAIDAAAGGTVTFACSGTISVSPPITVAGGQQVSLDSTGQAIVLRGSSDRIFDVDGGSLVLTGSPGGNLVVRGGSRTGSPASGGAIFIAPGSTAELSHVTVRDSLVAAGPGGGAYGGAIHNDGSLTVDHSLFVHNGAVAGAGGDASGGAIFNGGSLELGADVSFSRNYASAGRGGAGGDGHDGRNGGRNSSGDSGGTGLEGGRGGSAFGGAIFSAGTLTASSRPAFSENSASGGAGGAGGPGGDGGDGGVCEYDSSAAEGHDGGDGGPGGAGGDGKGGAVYTTGGPIDATFGGNAVTEGGGGAGGPGGEGGTEGTIDYESDGGGSGCAPPTSGSDGDDGSSGQPGAAQEPDMYANCSPSCADTTAPVTKSTLSPASPTGLNGWYTAPIHVTLSATDSGSGVAETRCVIEPAVPPSTFDDLPASCAFTGAGRDVARGHPTLYFASEDNSGNREPVRSVAIKIDRTPPAVTLTPTGTLGSNGWFVSSVNVATSGTDLGSGVASCTPSQALTNETAGTLVNGSCADNAGLFGTATPLTIAIDKTAPTAAIDISPASPDGFEGWYKRPPRLLVAGTDGISGIAETRCALDPATAPASYSQLPAGCPYLTSATLNAGGRHTLYAASMDRAGRVSAVEQVSWKLDNVAPTIACTVTPKPLVPADHRLVDVAAGVVARDDRSGIKGFSLVGVSSNQPDSGLGPDDRPNDIQGFAPGSADRAGRLRAEAYAGTRYYTLKYQAQDRVGNKSACNPKVNVPLG